MVSCSIKHCGAKKCKNHPTLSFHKFPTNEILRRKWLDVIDIENVNPRHKVWFVCSLHFEESCLNRTLDIMRLREGAIPSSSLLPRHTQSNDYPDSPSTLNTTPEHTQSNNNSDSLSTLNTTHGHTQSNNNSGSPSTSNTTIQHDEIKNLIEHCDVLKKKIKTLKQQVKRRDSKIADLYKIIEQLQKRKFNDNEELYILDVSNF